MAPETTWYARSSVVARIAIDTRTSRSVNPFSPSRSASGSAIVPHRPLEDRERSVERLEAQGPLQGGVFFPLFLQEDPRRGDESPGEVPDLGGDVQKAVLAFHTDPGD